MSNEAAAAAREHDPVLPRTEGERHLPDGVTPSSKDLNRTESPDEETLRMLEEAGLDSSMIDPSSLKALQELCTPKSHGKSLKAVEDSKQPAIPNLTAETIDETKEHDPFNASVLSAHVPSEVLRPIALGRVTSDLTMGLRSESMIEEETDASTAGSTQRVTTMDKCILDQLQLQTALLLDLQRRVDELSQIVVQQQGQLQQQQAGLPPDQIIQNFFQANQMANQGGNVPPPVQPQQQARNAPQPPAVQEPPRQNEMFIFHLFTSVPAYIRSTRVAEICRVYWALHRRDVGGRIDGNLILKILVMAAILMSKMSTSKQRKRGDRSSMKSTLQFYVTIFMIVGGFMWQSGYARFLYNFFVKEGYPQRIWSGEVIDVAAQQPPQRAEPRQQRQVQEDEVAQGPGLLRGGIPQAPAQAGFSIGKLLMDIVYLFGSFLLSILPMWKAEAQPRGERQGDANQRPNGQQNEQGEEQGGDEGMEG